MPSSTTSNSFAYVYVLHSQKDGKKYIGLTNNLKRRMQEHHAGKSFATVSRRPLRLIYYEACLSAEDAKRRERYLKTTSGRRFLAKRLHHYLFSKK